MVIMVQNNQYAISMPVERQTNSDTIAQKALAYGIEGIQVDGNDVLAVIEGMNRALEKARNGEPVLLEAVTYRLEDHTTSDDSTRYRDEEEIEEWEEHDPLLRLKEYLKENDLWDDSLEDYEDEAEQEIKEAADKAMEVDDPDMKEMFEHVYKDMPDLLRKDME
jgi:pyruvate dehydrogenase E1 component alpha subunit